MDEKNDLSLHARIDRLEKMVLDLQRSLDQLKTQNIPQSPTAPVEPKPTAPPPERAVFRPAVIPQHLAPKPTPPATPPPAATRPPQKSFELPAHMRKSEYWLNKIGIGLILFAVVFLFKYSIDQGWLTPPVRILFGLALGTALLIIGYRIHVKKRHFSQVLIGGAIATYYITGYAAFQIFALVSHPVAFGFMVAVTLLAFLVSLMQDEAILSLIGTLGGLGTPFLMYTGAGSIPGLMTYTCLVLAGTSAVYFYRGWNSLLWLSIIGGWIVFLIGLSDAILPNSQVVLSDQWAIQVGVLFGWLFFWAVPVMREAVSVGNSEKWRRASIGFGDNAIGQDVRAVVDKHLFLITVVVPFITMGISKPIWPELTDVFWGWITMGGAVIYGFAFWILKRREQFKNLALTHAIMGLLFFTIALSLLLEGDTLILALAAEATALHFVARQVNKKAITIFAHVLFGIICLWLGDRLYLTQLSRLMDLHDGTPILNARALTDLVVIGLGVLMSVRLRLIFEKRIYLIISLVAFGAWLCRELSGNILLVAITAEAIIIHYIARWKNDRAIAAAGHAFFGGIAIWLIGRLFNPHTEQTAIINAHALVNLLIIAAAVGTCKLFKTINELKTYLLCAHIAFLGWFLSELAPLDNGQGYVTICWGVYAAVLLVAGLMKDQNQLRNVAMVTLFVVVGKLFLVDLANLEVLWRILLFLGFGGLFLFLSYYFQNLWKSKDVEKPGNTE
jgi:hypothetical protein